MISHYYPRTAIRKMIIIFRFVRQFWPRVTNRANMIDNGMQLHKAINTK